MYETDIYKTPSGRAPIKDYLGKLAKERQTKDLAQIKLAINRLKEHGMGVNTYFPETIRKIQDDIYELRPGAHRVFFFYFYNNRFVLLHAYRKRSQRTPKPEIDKAVSERDDYKRRYRNE